MQVSFPTRDEDSSLLPNEGRELLQESPAKIDVNLLQRYPSFLEFRNCRRATDSPPDVPTPDSGETPEDSLAAAYRILRDSLETELLQQIKDSSSYFFERLVVDLLVKMGLGEADTKRGEP